MPPRFDNKNSSWGQIQAKRAPVSALSALKEMKYMINTNANFATQPIFAM